MKDDDNNKPDDETDFNEEFDFGDEDDQTEGHTEPDLEHESFEQEGFEHEDLEHDELPDLEEGDEPIISEQPPRKNLLLPILIAVTVIGFIVWKVIGHFTKPAPEPIVAEQPKPEPMPVTPPPKGVEAPTMVAQPKAPMVNLEDKKQQMLELLKEEVKTQDETLNAKVTQLQNNFNKAVQESKMQENAVQELQAQVQALTESLKQVSEQLNAIRQDQVQAITKAEAKRQRPKAPKLSATAIANPKFVIHAIIPGRAWLKTVNGKTITVSEGDSMGDYGKVIKIDAHNGLVITSSGITLR